MKTTYKLYGAYGSNMNVAQMKLRCPQAVPIGQVELPDWELVFRGVADIQECKKAFVPIAIWEITEECEDSLDHYEGYPWLYTKIYLETDMGQVMLYIMNDRKYQAPPSQGYLQSISSGYEDFGFDTSLLKDPINRSYTETSIESRFKAS